MLEGAQKRIVGTWRQSRALSPSAQPACSQDSYRSEVSEHTISSREKMFGGGSKTVERQNFPLTLDTVCFRVVAAAQDLQDSEVAWGVLSLESTRSAMR